MAFATSNIRKGTCGDLKVTAGNWSGIVGDASGTLAVEGTQVYHVAFETNDTTGPSQKVPVTWTVSGSVTTLTVHNRELTNPTTSGTFCVIHA